MLVILLYQLIIQAPNQPVSAGRMNISDVITPSRIEVRLSVSSKDELLHYIPEILNRNGDVLDLEDVRRVILHREQLMSTGIGHGIAFPHGKTNAVVSTTAALVTLQDPIDYDSIDGEPVQLAVLLVGKEDQVSSHLKLLSKVSRVVASDWFRHEALQASTPEEVYALLVRADTM